MLKIGIHADFQLRSFYVVKTPAKVFITAASMPPKAVLMSKGILAKESY
jgi:hypothetical protein